MVNILSFKIKITEAEHNPLLKRKEINFKIAHPNSGTPNRMEVKEVLAAMETVDENLVFIKKIGTVFGCRYVVGRADIYDDEEHAKIFEPIYMKIRNIPKEERSEARKKIKPRNRHKRLKKTVI
ncbi:MAG: 30S ribosomal protein S24e [Promethearchaeota archaeon]